MTLIHIFDFRSYGVEKQFLKSASQHLYHIRLSLTRKLCSKKSLLLTCQILGLLVNTLATDEKYHIKDTYSHAIISSTKKRFLNFFRIFRI